MAANVGWLNYEQQRSTGPNKTLIFEVFGLLSLRNF